MRCRHLSALRCSRRADYYRWERRDSLDLKLCMVDSVHKNQTWPFEFVEFGHVTLSHWFPIANKRWFYMKTFGYTSTNRSSAPVCDCPSYTRHAWFIWIKHQHAIPTVVGSCVSLNAMGSVFDLVHRFSWYIAKWGVASLIERRIPSI